MADPIINRYRVRLPLLVHTEDGSYQQGEEFEKEFSVEDEAENLDNGLLEIVPRKYKVIGDSRVNETDPGDEFEAALRLGQERFLIEAGHIERVEAEPKKPSRKKKEAK
jgi:hypothetical protein